MDKDDEIRRLEAELEFIQNEINRRHERVDGGVDPAHNQEKIDELRVKKNKLRERLAQLQEG